MKINFKKLIVTVFMMVCIFSVANAEFTDVAPNHWGYSKIMEFVENGYIKGYGDAAFKPDNTITRAEFACIANNFYGYTGNENVVSNFSDVDQNEWYAGAVNEAFARGYMIGYKDGTFRPNAPITREEAITVLAKILGIAENEIPETDAKYLEKYSDYKDIADWALKAVYNYSVRNFINGYSDGTLRPIQNITRAEAVYIFRTVEQQIVVEEEKENEKGSFGGGNFGGGSSGGGSSSGGSSSTQKNDFEITLEVGDNGSATCEDKILKGENAIIKIQPNGGYKLASITDNTVAVDLETKVVNNEYIINNVQEDHTVVITFTEIVIDNTEDDDTTDEETEEQCKCEECIEKLIATIKNLRKEVISDEMWQEILEKAKEQITQEDLAQLQELIDVLKEELDVPEEEIKAFIDDIVENHNCEDVQNVINEIIEMLENKKDLETLIKELKAYLGENVSEEKIRETVNNLIEKYETTAKELKDKIEGIIAEQEAKTLEEIRNKLEELKAKQEKIEEIINQIISEAKEYVPTQKELENIAKDLLAKQEATLENLKQKLEEKINKKIAANEAKWNTFLEGFKSKLEESMPDSEDLLGLLAKIEDAIPAIEELTGVDVGEIASKLNINSDTIETVIEAINGNEELKEILEDTIKDKITDVLVDKLAGKDEVANALDQIYDTTGKDVVDLLLFLDNNDPTGIVSKIILSNTQLSDIIASSSDLADDQLETIVSIAVDYYGLADFVKAVDGDANAKQLLTVALSNADISDVILLLADEDAKTIILKYFDLFELEEIIGDAVEDIWNNLSKEELLEMLIEFAGDEEKIEKIKAVMAELFSVTTVSYDKNNSKATGSMKTSKHTNNEATALNENKFELDGYTFIGWEDENGKSYAADASLKSKDFGNVASITLYADWEADVQEVSGFYSDAAGNSMIVSVNEVQTSEDDKTIDAKTDEEVKVIVKVAEGYKVAVKVGTTNLKDYVEENGERVYSFIMPADDVAVSAKFSLTSLNITEDPDIENGTINIPEFADEGDTVTVTATPSEGYELTGVTFDGTDATEVNDTTYTFEMPGEDVTVSATFGLKDYSITVANDAKDYIEVQATAKMDETVTVDVTIPGAYDKYRLIVNDEEIEDNIDNFIMPAKDVTINIEIYYSISTPTPSIKGSIVTVSSGIDINNLGAGDLSELEAINSANEGDMVYVFAIGGVGYEGTFPFGKVVSYSAKKITVTNLSDKTTITVTPVELPDKLKDLEKTLTIFKFEMKDSNVNIEGNFN